MELGTSSTSIHWGRDGTGQVCHSVPILGTLLLVTTVHSPKYRQPTLPLVVRAALSLSSGTCMLRCPILGQVS